MKLNVLIAAAAAVAAVANCAEQPVRPEHAPALKDTVSTPASTALHHEMGFFTDETGVFRDDRGTKQ